MTTKAKVLPMREAAKGRDVRQIIEQAMPSGYSSFYEYFIEMRKRRRELTAAVRRAIRS